MWTGLVFRMTSESKSPTYDFFLSFIVSEKIWMDVVHDKCREGFFLQFHIDKTISLLLVMPILKFFDINLACTVPAAMLLLP